MTKYPNREALRKAHDIYLDAMRPFIIRCLKRIQGRTLEDLIRDVSDYEPNDYIETLIDVNNIPRLVKNHWHDIFSKDFNSDLNVQNTTWLIVEGRNLWAHPGKEDVDPESTRMYLTLTARVLGEIKNQEAKQTVESVRNKLFADKECLADMAKQLDAAKAENTELEKQVKTKSDRLEEFEAEWIASEERLETVSTQLKIAVAGKTVAEDRLSDISNRFADVEMEKAELEKRLKVVEAEKAELEKRLPEDKDDEPSSDERVGLPTGKEMEQPALRFLIDRKEHRRVEIIDWLTEHFSLTDDERRYLSRTGQAEKHLMNKGLIERIRTGYYRITVNGLKVFHGNGADEDSVFPNEVDAEVPSYLENTEKSPKSQRKWRRPGAVAALRDPAEIRKTEANIARILNPSEKSRLERELREAKRAVDGS